MEVTPFKDDRPQHIFIGLLTNDNFLKRVASEWPEHGGHFKEPHENTVARWCVDYFGKVGKAPGAIGIQPYLDKWRIKHLDDENDNPFNKGTLEEKLTCAMLNE